METGERIAKGGVGAIMFTMAIVTFLYKVPMYPLIFSIAGCYFIYRACE